jgi:hypothetical protein
LSARNSSGSFATLAAIRRNAITAATFMRCSFVTRYCFAWGKGSSKEQRHEAEEGEEIEEVSSV